MSHASRVVSLERRAGAAVAVAAAAAVTLMASAPGALAQGKPRVPASEYGRWETPAAGDLSPDGAWVTYEIRRGNGRNELHYRATAGGDDHVIAMAAGAQFTRDSRYLAYTIAPDTGGVAGGGRGGRGGRGGGAGGAADTPARNRVGILDLKSGASLTFDDVQAFALSHAGSYAALRRYRAPGGASRGADLVVRDLERGTQVTLGNVAEFSWNDDAPLLAMTVDVDGRTGNGVQLLDAASGAIRSLDAADRVYTALAWRAHAADLAVFRSRIDSAFVDTAQVVLAWRNVGTAARPVTYDFADDAAFPAGMRVASYRALQWSGDGNLLLFGIAPREPRPAPAGRGATPARVQVWHWKDMRQFHQQEVNAAQDRQRTLPVSWRVGGASIATLSDDYYAALQLAEQRTAALLSDQTPYAKEVLSGRAYHDVYRVDVATGKREPIVSHTVLAATISPSGRYVLYGQKGQWWSYDAQTAKRANLTERARGTFTDLDDDHPTPERAMSGFAGWAPGETAAFVYDQYDLWKVALDGSGAERLTRGREDTTVYRHVALDADRAAGAGGRGGFGGAPPVIDVGKPVVLSATGERSKKSGYARLAGGKVESLVLRDKSVSALRKARDADRYLFLEQSYAESPNYFVAASDALASATAVSHTNAFQADYAWGRQVLMDYRNKRGDKLQMMLTYPANYQPGKKYPMVVYYYEKLSQGFHQYVPPSDRAVYNTQVFSQEGYFVLRPDIVFQKRNPGLSGLDCVTSAVKEAVARVSDIDAKKVGAMGHSWGGYQTAFYAVHAPETFAAAIAGAPLTDLVSFYGYTSGNSGLAEAQHFETGQERMDVSLWEDRQAYIRNSTVFALDSLRIPLLLEEGDSDGNVNPFQSQEVYNFGRRLGKEVVYLVYEGENHNVARAESQRDYQARQLDWFAHYLKGEPAADWIVNGEPYLTRQKILRGGATAAPAGTGTAVRPGGAPDRPRE